MATQTQRAAALEMRRKFDAPATAIYEAWTQPGQMQKWLAPTDDFRVEADADPRVGGSYRVQMTTPTGEIFTARGEYTVVEPPHRLSFYWSWDENDEANDSVVTVELTDVEGGCELLLRHERLASEESRQKHDQGWNGCLARLAKLV